ncbi:hypothetical protein [uncultured Oscillibacter sp.]|uniref:hypothetical protein n=1 Tax=uncultured Oscillibacter sp. TaxID=876091 RepID=UPI0025F5D30E|nr:hypothetical protein [uncultured Oscillibacter sp.]
MKLKSTLSLVCVTGLMAMALAGCGSSGGNSANPTSAASNSANTSESSESGGSQIIGQVQSISDKTVTLLLGTMEDGGQGQAGGPAQPAGSSASGEPIKPSDEGQAPSGSQPSGQQPGGQPDGKQPGGGQPGGGKTFVAGTETVFITIADDTAITVESISGETDGTIDDIKEGTVLDVVLGDNNTATSVIVKNIMAGPSAAPDDGNADLSAGSSSGAQSANN